MNEIAGAAAMEVIHGCNVSGKGIPFSDFNFVIHSEICNPWLGRRAGFRGNAVDGLKRDLSP